PSTVPTTRRGTCTASASSDPRSSVEAAASAQSPAATMRQRAPQSSPNGLGRFGFSGSGLNRSSSDGPLGSGSGQAPSSSGGGAARASRSSQPTSSPPNSSRRRTG